jgi:hypothetical protein
MSVEKIEANQPGKRIVDGAIQTITVDQPVPRRGRPPKVEAAGRIDAEAIAATAPTKEADKSEPRASYASSDTNKKPVLTAELHSAIRLNGHTESNLHRIPGIQMLWIKNEGLLIRVPERAGNFSEHLIPYTSVKIVKLS